MGPEPATRRLTAALSCVTAFGGGGAKLGDKSPGAAWRLVTICDNLLRLEHIRRPFRAPDHGLPAPAASRSRHGVPIVGVVSGRRRRAAAGGVGAGSWRRGGRLAHGGWGFGRRRRDDCGAMRRDVVR